MNKHTHFPSSEKLAFTDFLLQISLTRRFSKGAYFPCSPGNFVGCCFFKHLHALQQITMVLSQLWKIILWHFVNIESVVFVGQYRNWHDQQHEVLLPSASDVVTEFPWSLSLRTIRKIFQSTRSENKIKIAKYLTIIPLTSVGYEHEWNNCSIKYQTLDFVSY